MIIMSELIDKMKDPVRSDQRVTMRMLGVMMGAALKQCGQLHMTGWVPKEYYSSHLKA